MWGVGGNIFTLDITLSEKKANGVVEHSLLFVYATGIHLWKKKLQPIILQLIIKILIQLRNKRY